MGLQMETACGIAANGKRGGLWRYRENGNKMYRAAVVVEDTSKRKEEEEESKRTSQGEDISGPARGEVGQSTG